MRDRPGDRALGTTASTFVDLAERERVASLFTRDIVCVFSYARPALILFFTFDGERTQTIEVTLVHNGK